MSEETECTHLLARVAAGDARAYDSLFRKYYRAMVLYADRILNDPAESEDVVEELFCALWADRSRLQQVRSEGDYLFILLRNRIVDCLRRRNRFRREELADTWADESVEETLLEVDLYARLTDEIDHLPSKCAEVLRMRLQGLSDREISQQLGIEYETVRSHTKRGIFLIRRRMGKVHTIILFL